MPARGKHRRPKSLRFTRSIAVAGTGGAALALPLIGATGAHAATAGSVSQKATSVSPKAVTEKSEKAAAEQGEKSAATKKTAKRVYSVRPGDYLSRIAEQHHVAGGWKKIYADNREAVGSDPSLIHPGLKLTLGGKAPSGDSTSGGGGKATDETASPDKTASLEQTGPEKTEPKAESKQTETPGNEPTSTSVTPSAETSGSGFMLPVEGASVGTAYKTAGSMWSSGYHTGVDFVVPTGTSLKAVGAGTVVTAGWGGAYGNQVVIQLDDGHYAQYGHLSSLSVSAGQSVSEGQEIGLSGATGNVTGPHLHFEIRTGPDYGSDIDPVAYLRSKGVSL
ncbi:peptidoglycan DD-metalloendopeptidase family protein [Streptomyces sp. KM273126]|uniref:M23 family metallopeptidase n=1 Tax=Streptomyces sp. KM273126 TaxID=2545247 RepID=UPI00103C0DBB|nr:M23 family metallopeptidase [Streptomyces sp. KM273126]MBA2810451.1 peptidoglycan DD-metalloendopeptidase family protein [Streptomyces sp. KM273126]